VSRYQFVEPRPFAHQVATLNRILADGGVHALLHDPGTGKTRTVVDYCGVLATGLRRVVRVLVVCPKDVQDTWLTQLKTFLAADVACHAEILSGTILEKSRRLATLRDEVTPLPPAVLVAVVNIDAFSSMAKAKPLKTVTVADRLVQAVEKYAPDLLVLDESHRVRGPQGNAARTLAKVARTVPRRLLLTGTPMPHSPLDVWSQWRILAPETFDTAFTRFKYHYAEFGGWNNREVIRYRNLDQLHQRLARRSSVVHKSDALDLPPTMDVLHPVDLTAEEQRAYRAMRDQLVTRLDSGSLTTADNRLVQLLRLRQITSGYLKDDDGHIRDLGPGKRAAALSLLKDLLASEHRIVVFAWGRHEVDQLHAELRAEAPYGAESMLITGATSDTDRRAIRARFGSDDPARLVLIAQIRTMSLGINELVTANHALYLSQSQQRDDYEQSRARLDRSGQTRSVTYHHLIVLDTVDEVVLKSHQQKSDLEQALLDHVRRSR
jgi:SNF2 family DNA or RNA helicase